MQQVVTTSQVNSVNHEKVVLMGRGLTGAQVHEEAEFVIDGTDAGPGKYPVCKGALLIIARTFHFVDFAEGFLMKK